MKSLQRYIGFVQFYRQYIPKLTEKLVPTYKLLQKDVKYELTQVHKYAIFDINENLAKAFQDVAEVTTSRQTVGDNVRCW